MNTRYNTNLSKSKMLIASAAALSAAIVFMPGKPNTAKAQSNGTQSSGAEPTSKGAGVKEYGLHNSPAKTKSGESKEKISPNSIQEKNKWMPKVTSFAMADMKLTKALVAGDLEKAKTYLTPEVEDADGDLDSYLVESVIPFFADHYRNGNYSPGIAIRKEGEIVGFKSYHSFTNKKGKKKFFSYKTIEYQSKPAISAINCGDRIENNNPEMARQLKSRAPKVEMIEPTPEPSKIWESKERKR